MTSSRTRLATLRTRLTRGRTLRQVLRNRDGAIDLASIMVGVIVIAIIAGILLASVFVVIPWTQDNVAKQDLDAVRTAEGVWRAQADDITFTDYATLLAAHKIQSAPRVNAATDPAKDCYVAVSGSTTGNVYWNSSVDPSVRQYKSGDTSDCAGVDLGGLVGGLPVIGSLANGGGSTSSGSSGGTSSGTTATGALYYVTSSADGNSTYFDIYNADGTVTTAQNTSGWYDSPAYFNQTDGSQPHAVLNGKFYFASYDNNNAYPLGHGISVFDGTTVSQATDASTNIAVTSMATYNGKIYFLGKDVGTKKDGLYSFDGSTVTLIDSTASSTTPPTITYNTLASQYGSSLAVFNGKLYYPAVVNGGAQVSAYDGTSIADISNTNVMWRAPVVVGGRLYFAGTLGGLDYLFEIWPDGTITGNELVSNSINVAGGNIYNSPDNGTTWHKITPAADETSNETVTTVPGEPFDVGSKMFMLTNNNTSISEWDGSNIVKTTPLPAGVTYNDGSVPSATTDSAALFAASNSANETQVWSFDGTSFTQVSNLSAGTGGASIGAIHTVGSTAMMDLSDSVGNENLYVSVGGGAARFLNDHTAPYFEGGTAQ